MSPSLQTGQLKKSDKIDLNRIVPLITSGPSAHKIIDKYTEIRIQMDLPPKSNCQLSSIKAQSEASVAVSLLGDWLAKAGKLATVEGLQKIFKEVGLQDFSEAIESKLESYDDDGFEHDKLLRTDTSFEVDQTPEEQLNKDVQRPDKRACKSFWNRTAGHDIHKTYITILLGVILVGSICALLLNRNPDAAKQDHNALVGTTEHTTQIYPTKATIFTTEAKTSRVYIQSYKDYQSHITNCNRIYILVIVSKDIQQWPPDFSPICGNLTRELHINGTITSKTFKQMLEAFTSLQLLSVGTFGNITRDLFLEGRGAVLIRNLTSLQFHCRKCTALYAILPNLINLNHIIEVTVNNLLINNDNYEVIQNFFSKLSQIRELKINVELDTIESFFHECLFPRVKVLEANFSFYSPGIESEINLYDNFRMCESFPQLQTLISNNWPYMFKTLRTCRHLVNAYLIVNDDETERFRDLTVFSNHMSNLRYLDLLIIYPAAIVSCPAENILGLSKLQCKQFLMYDLKAVNCPVQTCPVTSYKLMKSTPKCSIPPKTHKNC